MEVTKNHKWTREQLLVAFTLYTQTSFGRLHSRNPDIIKYAKLIGRTPSALAMKLVNIASLDPVIVNSGRKGLQAASKMDKAMWQEMNDNWEAFWTQSELVMVNISKQTLEPKEKLNPAITSYSAENKSIISSSRYGQNSFRKAVLSAHEEQCCITGISNTKLLVASHIIPWAEDKSNRLNPRNGLCLSNLHDKAFDSGLLTLNESLEVVLSKELRNDQSLYNKASFILFEGKRIQVPKKFAPDQEFLSHHRQHIFQA